MPYPELKKVYYSDPEHYKDIYTTRYNSPYTQHIDFLIGQNPAFFVVTPEIQSRMLAIHKLDKKSSLSAQSFQKQPWVIFPDAV